VGYNKKFHLVPKKKNFSIRKRSKLFFCFFPFELTVSKGLKFLISLGNETQDRDSEKNFKFLCEKSKISFRLGKESEMKAKLKIRKIFPNFMMIFPREKFSLTTFFFWGKKSFTISPIQ